MHHLNLQIEIILDVSPSSGEAVTAAVLLGGSCRGGCRRRQGYMPWSMQVNQGVVFSAYLA